MAKLVEVGWSSSRREARSCQQHATPSPIFVGNQAHQIRAQRECCSWFLERHDSGVWWRCQLGGPCKMKGGVLHSGNSGLPEAHHPFVAQNNFAMHRSCQAAIPCTGNLIDWGLRKEFHSYGAPGLCHDNPTSVENGQTSSRCSNVCPS